MTTESKSKTGRSLVLAVLLLLTAVALFLLFSANVVPQEQRAPVATDTENTDQIKTLFDYTKFHIGLYSTLTAVVISVLASKRAASWKILPEALTLAAVALACAGLAGGVIASSLPHLFGKFDVRTASIGPLTYEYWRLSFWTYVEHCAFWIAVLLVFIAFGPTLFGARVQSGPEPMRVIIDNGPNQIFAGEDVPKRSPKRKK